MSGLSRRWPQLDVTLAAGGLFLFSYALVNRWFWAHGQLVDWPVYQTYGDAIVHHGLVPYRDFAVEYPPAALAVFVIPSLAGDYRVTFEVLMAACGVGLVAVVATIRPAAAYFVAVSPVLVGSLILSRFDLWPALLTTGALAALLGGRHRLGWALLGIAVAAKLWPVVLVPLALAWSLMHGRLRASLAGVATFALAVVPFAVVGAHGLYESVRGQGDRPLQIESLGASLLTTFGHPLIATACATANTAPSAPWPARL
jgi:uncharacterized membrane protein